MTINEDKVLYAQHNQGRGWGCGGLGYGHSRNRGSINNNEEKGQRNKQNWCGRGYDHGRYDRFNNPNVKYYNCEKYGMRQRISMLRRKWKKMKI